EGGDRVIAGAGADLVLGDQGVVTGSATGLFGTLTSLENELPGDDHIEAGAGNDIVVAGLGNDSVFAGQGEDIVLGDSGHVEYSGLSAIERIVLEDQDRGGDDYITAAGVGGDNILIGQFGKDEIYGGTDDDVILGDFALFEFLPGALGFAGQSSADRVARIEAIRADLTFDDALFGDLGSDFMMGGMGDDTMYGDGGQDVMIGDTVILVRSWTAKADGAVFEETTLDTNFAFLDGGYDRLYSGTGPDVMIGGLGADIFFGDTQFDLIYSDGYAGLFNATWEEGFSGPTPQRFLIKSNFAGTGAIDVVSESQQDASIGGPLDLRHLMRDDSEIDERPNAMDRLSAVLAGGSIPNMTQLVIEILGSYNVVEAISALLASGVDTEVLLASLRVEVLQQLLAMNGENLIVAEMLIDKIIAMYLRQAGLLPDADSAGNSGNASDGGNRLWNIAAE
ncbi:MAG: calcium-binding protein, partial [Paracoccaceae bacterium]